MKNGERINRTTGQRTLIFSTAPDILGTGTAVGKKEGEGPLGKYFDIIHEDNICGQKTWEKAESCLMKESVRLAVQRGGKTLADVDYFLAGDLLNQLMSSGFAARDLAIPFLGLYGACSTMTESLLLGALLVDGGYAGLTAAAASSHYCTAERQFRMPLEHGNQRPPAAQWTATAAGAVLIGREPNSDSATTPTAKLVPDSSRALHTSTAHEPGLTPRIRITAGTIGRIIDPGLKDTHQMGASMAPAAVDTICRHLWDRGLEPDYFDRIYTGDLGYMGAAVFQDLMKKQGMDVAGVHQDCGIVIYEEEQDAHSGGSGCGCSASVFGGYVYKEMRAARLKKVLLVSTGALMTTLSSQQGETIPGIAHAVSVEAEERS